MGNSKTGMKNGLEDSMIQGRTAVGRVLLEGRTVGSSKKEMKSGLGDSMIQGITAVMRAMLEAEQ